MSMWCAPGDTLRLTKTGEEAVVVKAYLVNAQVRKTDGSGAMWRRKDVTVQPKEGGE